MLPPPDPRAVALDTLLAQPDPPELPPRRHRVVCAGRDDRMETLVVPLVVAYMVRRYVETHVEDLPRVQPRSEGRWRSSGAGVRSGAR